MRLFGGDDVEKSKKERLHNQFFPYFIDISGPHSYHQIIRLAIFQEIFFNFLFGQGPGADPKIVGLPGGVYFGKDHVIRQSQGLREFIHQSLGPGVSVGLEDAPELSVRVVKRGPQRCLDLCGVMRVVVDDCEAVPASQDLEAPLGSGIARDCARRELPG